MAPRGKKLPKQPPGTTNSECQTDEFLIEAVHNAGQASSISTESGASGNSVAAQYRMKSAIALVKSLMMELQAEKEEKKRIVSVVASMTQQLRSIKAEYHAAFTSVCSDIDAIKYDWSNYIEQINNALKEQTALVAEARDLMRQRIKRKNKQLELMRGETDAAFTQTKNAFDAVDGLLRNISEAQKEAHVAESARQEAEKKLHDELFLAANQKCRSCQAADAVRQQMTGQMVETEQKAGLIEYELAKQRRIVEMLTKSLQKEEFEKNTFKGANEKLAQTGNHLRQTNKQLGEKIEKLRAELTRQQTLNSLAPSAAAALTPPDSASDTSSKDDSVADISYETPVPRTSSHRMSSTQPSASPHSAKTPPTHEKAAIAAEDDPWRPHKVVRVDSSEPRSHHSVDNSGKDRTSEQAAPSQLPSAGKTSNTIPANARRPHNCAKQADPLSNRQMPTGSNDYLHERKRSSDPAKPDKRQHQAKKSAGTTALETMNVHEAPFVDVDNGPIDMFESSRRRPAANVHEDPIASVHISSVELPQRCRRPEPNRAHSPPNHLRPRRSAQRSPALQFRRSRSRTPEYRRSRSPARPMHDDSPSRLVARVRQRRESAERGRRYASPPRFRNSSPSRLARIRGHFSPSPPRDQALRTPPRGFRVSPAGPTMNPWQDPFGRCDPHLDDVKPPAFVEVKSEPRIPRFSAIARNPAGHEASFQQPSAISSLPVYHPGPPLGVLESYANQGWIPNTAPPPPRHIPPPPEQQISQYPHQHPAYATVPYSVGYGTPNPTSSWRNDHWYATTHWP